MPDPPQITNPGFFNGVNYVSMTGAQLIDVLSSGIISLQNINNPDGQITFNSINNCLAPLLTPLPHLLPLKHSSTFFVGRDGHLQRLKGHFGSHIEGQRKSFLLHGLGGIGKTQICLRFIEENAHLFSDIHWLDASSEATIELGLVQIAQAKNAPQESRHSPGSVLQWISQGIDWLIIYDNADGDYSVVEKFLPPGNEGNILITSRNWELKRLALGSLHVDDMTNDEAVSLLLKSAMLDVTSGDGAKKVVSKLGGIPLALDQAGAYIHKSGCGIDGYLELYQKNKLMSRKEFKGASGYGKSAYETWDISMQQIKAMAANKSGGDAHAAQSAIRLLKIFAFLDHENIPEMLFKNAAKNYIKLKEWWPNFPIQLLDHQTLFLGEEGTWEKVQFLEGIQVLLSFSLIRAANCLYSMHLLVNTWNRSCIPKTEIGNHYHRARALLSCAVVPDWNIDNYPLCKWLAPHIRSNMLHGVELGLQEKYYSYEYDTFAIVFNHVGSWGEEEKILHAAICERKAELGSDHPLTLSTMNQLALTFSKQGRWGNAEKLQAEVMDRQKAQLGSDHLDNFVTMNHLAMTYLYQGKWDEAENLQLKVRNKKSTMLGTSHPSTLETVDNLASTYWHQGRWDEAEELQREVMNVKKVKLGSDHPDTLITMNNLALTCYHNGKLDEAEKLQAEVVNTNKVKLGLNHPYTLTNLNNLALIHLYQGRQDEAEKMQVDVLIARKISLGSDHPDTLTTMNNLALTYCHNGKLNEAEKLQAEVVNRNKEKLGSNHPYTLNNMSNLASIYLYQGRWDEAEEMQVEVLNAKKVKFGSDHPSTLHVMHDLASTYQHQGRKVDAERLQVEVLNTRKVKLGINHPSTINSMDHLASIYSDQGRWDEAEKLQMEVTNARRERHGPNHPNTLVAMGALALIYKHQKRFGEAESLLSCTLQTMQQVGAQHHIMWIYKKHLDELLEMKQVYQQKNNQTYNSSRILEESRKV